MSVRLSESYDVNAGPTGNGEWYRREAPYYCFVRERETLVLQQMTPLEIANILCESVGVRDPGSRRAEARQRATAGKAIVYFIQGVNGGPIKIGSTTCGIERRLGELQTGSPVPLVVLAVVPGTRKLERQLHHRLRQHRLHGEWFAPEAFGDAIAHLRGEGLLAGTGLA